MTDTVLITGCSSGFGEAAAKLFATRGWNVIATMRDVADGTTLNENQNILVLRLDVQDKASIETAINVAISRFGSIEVVVNNAGYGLFSLFEAAPREAIQKQFDVNVFGVMDVIRAILPHFRANRSGTIINVSSGAGVFGAAMASVYSASKFALEGFSEALSYELADLGIKVKIIEPGGVSSTGFMARARTETQTLAQPEDYKAFLTHISQVYGSMAAKAETEALNKVAQAIFDAATDETDQLRYLPTENIRPLVTARREASEKDYMALTRGIFLPRPVTNGYETES